MLASRERNVLAFRATYKERRPGKDDAEAIRTRIQQLLEPVAKALASGYSAYTPNDKLLTQLDQERKAVTAMIDSWREPRLQIEALTDQAAQSNEHSPVTLEQAIRSLNERQAEEQARIISEEEETARKKLAAAKAANVQQETENELAKIKTEQEAGRIRAEREAQEAREAAEHEQAVTLAKSEEVRKLLYPFFAPGHWQPNSAAPTLEIRPVSLRDLQAIGALEPSFDGLYSLWICGNASWSSQNGSVADKTSPDLERPRWGYSGNWRVVSRSQEQLLQLQQAQKYLRELGDVFVELGMLSP
jgi:hypothetical protein